MSGFGVRLARREKVLVDRLNLCLAVLTGASRGLVW